MQAFVPKNRKPKFELLLKIVDLNNVPLVTGSSFIKWHLPHSASAEHRGRTAKCTIKDHQVVYDYQKESTIRLTVDKAGVLQESLIHFEVIQEYSSGGRGERITLGFIKLNLAEFADEVEVDDAACRRYLMQESKINSTLKIGIYMKQIEGDRNYIVYVGRMPAGGYADYSRPSLKTAHVFGGIAGLMAGEQGDDDPAHMPILNKTSKEHGELQDMYRSSLAASWAAQPGELKADECIEDIFAGGDGWADKEQPYEMSQITKLPNDDESTSHSDSESRNRPRSQQHSHRNHHNMRDRSPEDFPSGFPRRAPNKPIGERDDGVRDRLRDDGVRGRGSLQDSAKQMKATAHRRKYRPAAEIDEFDIREDLRSWKV